MELAGIASGQLVSLYIIVMASVVPCEGGKDPTMSTCKCEKRSVVLNSPRGECVWRPIFAHWQGIHVLDHFLQSASIPGHTKRSFIRLYVGL